MNINKYFPILIHALALGAVGGWAYGAHHTPGTSMTVVGISTGLSIALALSLVVRVFDIR